MFTEQQLEHIKSVAQKKKNQGELSVYIGVELFWSDYDYSDQELTIIKYCAEECKRQHSRAREYITYWGSSNS